MAAGHSQRRRGVGAGSPSSASSPNSVRAELVEAPSFPRPREKTERPFDKLRPNGLEGAASGSARTGSGFSNTDRSEGHTSELQSLMRSSSAVFCLKTKKTKTI